MSLIKRDLDLIRDILLIIEAKSTPTTEVTISDFSSLKKTKEELFYHIQLLKEANYVQTITVDAALFFTVNHITNDGHDYIASISDSSIWAEVKKRIGPQISTVTFDIVKSVAVDLIKAHFGF